MFEVKLGSIAALSLVVSGLRLVILVLYFVPWVPVANSYTQEYFGSLFLHFWLVLSFSNGYGHSSNVGSPITSS